MDERSSSPAASCCFCFVSKRKKGKSTANGSYAVKEEEDDDDGGLETKKDKWGKNDEMLSDLSTFSVKEQERRLKKAMEEQAKVLKEAERVVKWVKQESSRMDVSAIDRVLREDGDDQLVK